jgi:Tfp pilus assembly protein PilX
MRKLSPRLGTKPALEAGEQGFITLIICLVLVLAAVLALVYLRVLKAQR